MGMSWMVILVLLGLAVLAIGLVILVVVVMATTTRRRGKMNRD